MRRVTRRTVQVWLGWLWLLDGALQLQPFMFGPGFAHQVIAPAGQGQPGFVAGGVAWAAGLVSAHPMLWDYLFAQVQLLIGIGLLLRSTARWSLAVSIAWAVGVWYFGEGLGGLASGHADLLTGAPGAVLLYAVLAAAAWPAAEDRGEPADRGAQTRWPASWLPLAWAALWVGAALFRALPGQNSAAALAAEISGNADGAPAWLAQADRWSASAVHGLGLAVVVVAVLVQVGIGAAGLVPGLWRRAAAATGAVVALFIWVVGQSLGELYTGQATDPNSAPLVILLAFALVSVPDNEPELAGGRVPEPAG